MKKFLISLLLIIIGIIIGVIMVFVVIIGMALSFTSGSNVVIKNDSYLLIDFDGIIKEKPQADFPGLFNISKKQIELLDFVKSIQYASIDNKIKGIIINADLTYYDREHIEEINTALKKFKETGKKIYAWFSNSNNQNYLFCLQADRIFMPDTNSANLTLQGYHITSPYYKDGLDKIGLSFNVIHIGNYKGTGENYDRENMSKELRDDYTGIYESIFQKDISDISKSRKMDADEITDLISSGKTIMMTPGEAKKIGFIDELSSYQELKEKYKNLIPIKEYSLTITKNITGNKIAILYAEGTIYNYSNGTDVLGNEAVGSESFINEIQDIKNDDSIKAVIIRVNSPGGSALASELICQEIIKLKDKKPVYISMGPLAASGGYYLSTAGVKIFASETTITGSIGVVSILMNYKQLTDKLGINFETIKKFKYDDIFTASRAPTNEEMILMKNSMQKIYDEFTGHVIKERKISKDEISKIAEGRVWTGNQAVKNKLVDFIGGLDDTIEYVSRTHKINNYSIESFPKPEGFLSQLMNINQSKIENKIFGDFLNSREGKKIKKVLSIYYYGLESNKVPSMILPYYDLP